MIKFVIFIDLELILIVLLIEYMKNGIQGSYEKLYQYLVL